MQVQIKKRWEYRVGAVVRVISEQEAVAQDSQNETNLLYKAEPADEKGLAYLGVEQKQVRKGMPVRKKRAGNNSDSKRTACRRLLTDVSPKSSAGAFKHLPLLRRAGLFDEGL